MKAFLEDILYCIKLSFYFFIAPFVIGLIVGVVQYPHNYKEIVIWGCRLVQMIGAFGLGLAAISFCKRELMRPLSYEDKWKLYFEKLNLAFVILFISLFMSIFSYIIEILAKAYL